MSRHRRFFIHTAIFLTAFNIFFFNIARETTFIFDETRYVTAANQFLARGTNENWSHPPFGKMLIAAGIAVFGDNPVGWRLSGVVFGATLLNLLFELGLLLFGSPLAALQVVLLTLFNQMLFVQARIAMLDIFLATWIMAGCTLFLWSARTSRRWHHIASGVCFGLALATKWVAAAPLALCALWYLYENKNVWRQAIPRGALFWVVIPIVTYALAFLPSVGMKHPTYAPALHTSTEPVAASESVSATAPPTVSAPVTAPAPVKSGSPTITAPTPKALEVSDLGQLHMAMFKAQYEFQNPYHIGNCAWFTWPFMLKPTWFEHHFESRPEGAYRAATILLGNPIILWFGFVAILICVFAAWRREPRAQAIALFYLALWAGWVVVRNHPTFFYYYFPASLFLAPALVFAFQYLRVPKFAQWLFVVASAAIFIYFYPILASSFLPEKDYKNRFWFDSWTVESAAAQMFQHFGK